MARPRSKTEIHQLIASDKGYREDFEYIQSVLTEKRVFIGQLESSQAGNTEASFCVTVGMFQHQLPELVFSGVPVHLVSKVVEELCEGHDFDRDFLAGKRTKLIHDFNVIAVPINDPESHDVLSVCRDIYTFIDRPTIEAVQLVFANESGAFPWSRGYADQERQYQPVLGTAGSTH